MLAKFLLLLLPRDRPWRLEVTARILSLFSEIPMWRLFRPEEPERETEDLGEAGTERTW